MRRVFLVLLIGAITASAASAVDATITSVDGVVRVSMDGSQWQRATEGTELTSGDAIATGFRGHAVIAVGSSEVEISPLSQLSFSELLERGDAVSTEVSLPFGRVRAQVRSPSNREVDFRVVSPVSTASVKGTDFIYDGISLSVREGDVAIENLIGQTHSVRAGLESRAYGREPIVSVETYLAEEALLQ